MNPFIAVLGCGYWGKNLVRNFHASGALKLVCDPGEPGRATARQIAAGVEVVETFESALNRAEITAVAIAAPAALHYNLVKSALLAGKDVFVEKPLCLDVAQAQELVSLANGVSKVLMVGHLLQYHPHIQKLQALLAQGDLGKLQYITSNRLNLGKIRREENALWSFAPHDISVILSLANNRLPATITCTGGSYLNQGIADTTLTAMNFTGGLRAHIFVSWLNPFKEQKLTVVGSSGMAVFDDTKPWAEKLIVHRHYLVWAHGQVPTPSNVRGEAVVIPESEPLRNECQHFIECCHHRRIPRTDGHEGLRVLSVLQAAQLSLDHEGQPVDPSSPLQLPSSNRSSNWPSTANETVRAVTPDYFVHPTAMVDDGAEIGTGTKIWHFSHVMKGARIGARCGLGQNVNVDAGVVIGNNVKIQNNVSIYGGLIIEDDVFLGPSCVLTNVTNPRSQINRHSLYEQTIIKRGATIGANATIVCGLTIGRYAFVGAGAVLTRDVPDYGLVVGNPARQVGWISRHGHRLHTRADGAMTCPESGLRYRQANGRLTCIDLNEDDALPDHLRKGSRSYDDYKVSSNPEPASQPSLGRPTTANHEG